MWSLMPRIALYIYMGFYFYHSVSTVAADIKDEEPLWIIIMDAALLSLGFTGMCLYELGVSALVVKRLWRGASILIIMYHAVVNIIAHHMILRGWTEVDPKEVTRVEMLSAALLTIVILLPLMILNILYAYY
jgi:hypothetical protein